MVNLTSLSQVRALMDELDFRPSRTMGQSFLIDRNILDILVAAADLAPGDAVLEVGPGLGVVTECLLAECGLVKAVEKDRRLHAYLADRFADAGNLQLIHADAMDLAVPDMLIAGEGEGSAAIRKVVSNLPYSVGTRILVNLITAPVPPTRIVVTVQEEVADRITAAPDSDEYGMLSVWCQLGYECRILKIVSPTCFWPRPEVKSGILVLKARGERLLDAPAQEAFLGLTRQAFMRRRKQMATILSQGLDAGLTRDEATAALEEAGIDPRSRPEAMDVAAWCRLTRVLFPGAPR